MLATWCSSSGEPISKLREEAGEGREVQDGVWQTYRPQRITQSLVRALAYCYLMRCRGTRRRAREAGKRDGEQGDGRSGVTRGGARDTSGTLGQARRIRKEEDTGVFSRCVLRHVPPKTMAFHRLPTGLGTVANLKLRPPSY